MKKNGFILPLALAVFSGTALASRTLNYPGIIVFEDVEYARGDSIISEFVPTLPASNNLGGWQGLCPGMNYAAATPLPDGTTTPYPTVQQCGRHVHNAPLPPPLFTDVGTLILTNVGPNSQTVTILVSAASNIDSGFGTPSSSTVAGLSTLPVGSQRVFAGCFPNGVSYTPYHDNTYSGPWSLNNSTSITVSIGSGHTIFCVAGLDFYYGDGSTTYLAGSGAQRFRFVGGWQLRLTVTENLGAINGSIARTVGPNNYLIDPQGGGHRKPIRTIHELLNGGRTF